jgi:hypothetical protein
MGNKQGSNQPNIILNAKLGDGTIVHQGHVNCYMGFTSKCMDVLCYKRDLAGGYSPTNFRDVPSGYKDGAVSRTFTTRSHVDITEMYYTSYEECIDMLTKEDLALWYLDDGSLHKHKKFMHLYCNMFSEEEALKLADKIYSMYPIKKPSVRWDKKKDGREYVYLYIPAPTAREFGKDVLSLIEENQLYSMLYKVQVLDAPSTTIETTSA